MRKLAAAGIAALWLLLCGCAPHAGEPEGAALAEVLGVDGGGPVTLTAVCRGPEGDTILGGSAGADFCSAREKLPWSGEREVKLTSLSYLIINKNADLEEVLTGVLTDRELSPAALVWCAEDAETLLRGGGDAAARLEVLRKSGVVPPTAAEALAEWKAAGGVLLPEVKLENGRIEPAGEYAWEETE